MRRSCSNSRRSADKYLIIATHNQNKFFEIRLALGSFRVPVISLKEFPDIPEAPETGKSFSENARIKADFYYEILQKPLLAEDSGLIIPALNGYPGIYSARIAGNDPDRIALILEKLAGCADRSASYVCHMIFANGKETPSAEGICRGMIVEAPQGDQGFGYDPIFRPDESLKTFGQMTMKQKTNYSHRAQAVTRLLPKLLITDY
jgi:XTP/dITP diphosphohydrolase